jgi:hypothetical protein
MTEIDTAQDTLSAEHAAIYVYAALIGRLPTTADDTVSRAVSAAYAEHVGRRAELSATLRAAGVEPVVAAPVYRLPLPLGTAAQVQDAAIATETRAAETYAALVAAASGEIRSWAVSALSSAAVRLLTLGAPATAFPGAGELG